MSLSISPVNTCLAMAGAQTAFGGQGQEWTVYVSGTWSNGDEYTVSLTDFQTGVLTQVGAGYVTDQQPTFLTTYNNKVYALSGPTVYTCASNQPTVWNNPNGIGNGFVTMSDYYNIQENLQAVVPFQGRLAFFSRYSIQVWVVDPLISNWQQVQVLTNIGTMAPNSVQGLGDFDVLFLNDSGIRSLRVLTTTLQGVINDIGSPIDQMIQQDIAQSGLATVAASQSIVDPGTRRYWLFIPNTSRPNGVGNIYVISYYPSSKISAWSTYDPSYISGGSTTYFTPQFFGVYLGQVWVRDTGNNVYQFGGSNNNTYDETKMTVILPFLDGKRPGNKKKTIGFDLDVSKVVSQNWNVSISVDWPSGTFTSEASVGNPTFDQGWLKATFEGTHFALQVTTTDPSQATFASAVMYYTLGESPSGD